MKRRSLAMAASRAGSSAWASSGEEDVTTGILGDVGEPGVEAGSGDATCRHSYQKSVLVREVNRRGDHEMAHHLS